MSVRRDAMVVTAQPEATEVGAEILREGGNAVDAAVAIAFTQGVVDPLMAGISGFGSMGLYLPDKGVHGYIDFHSPAPAATRPDMWADLIESEARDGYGFVLKGRVNDVGYQSICVPASLRAYHDAHARHGRLPWAEVVRPAIAWARQGWRVRPHVHFLAGPGAWAMSSGTPTSPTPWRRSRARAPMPSTSATSPRASTPT
jgi:gamma-glutamyltranspeptidase/glutathione hydrolase